MANLKGGSFERQIRDANLRLAAFKEKRHGTNSHKTHSEATRVKREGYLRDFKEFAEKNELDGKLNELMTEANLADFLEQRLENLSFSSQEDYIRGWSGMLQGLEQVNISVYTDVSFFTEIVNDYKEDALERGEAIGEPKQVTTTFHPIEVINELPLSLSAIAWLQYETGFRVSEAYEVIQNLERYLDDLILHRVRGKGGHYYRDKIISRKLQLMLLKLREQLSKLPVQSTYYRHLQKYDMTAHDFRAFYVKELYEEKREEGYSHEEACLFVSREINHRRISITEYYLAKFRGV